LQIRTKKIVEDVLEIVTNDVFTMYLFCYYTRLINRINVN